jgi:protein-disulfide isomerase
MPEPKKFELSPSISIIIAGVIIAGAIVFVNLHPSAAVADPATPGQGGALTTNVPAPSASDHIVGSPTAPIVLIEYSDFQCPFCAMIYPTLKKIVGESNGSVAWVMRDYPLYQIHPQALPGAHAAECINDQLGNDAFWKFADTIFADQSKISPAYYAQVAQMLGANMTQYNSCISTSKFQSKIEAEIADAENSGGNGTPYTIVMNTKTGKQYPISGALPEAQIMAVIKTAENSQ